jgi:hypothetical protein
LNFIYFLIAAIVPSPDDILSDCKQPIFRVGGSFFSISQHRG